MRRGKKIPIKAALDLPPEARRHPPRPPLSGSRPRRQDPSKRVPNVD